MALLAAPQCAALCCPRGDAEKEIVNDSSSINESINGRVVDDDAAAAAAVDTAAAAEAAAINENASGKASSVSVMGKWIDRPTNLDG